MYYILYIKNIYSSALKQPYLKEKKNEILNKKFKI